MMLHGKTEKRRSDEGKNASVLSRLTTIHICDTVVAVVVDDDDSENKEDIHHRCLVSLMKPKEKKCIFSISTFYLFSFLSSRFIFFIRSSLLLTQAGKQEE
jgi:hypothetical protein